MRAIRKGDVCMCAVGTIGAQDSMRSFLYSVNLTEYVAMDPRVCVCVCVCVCLSVCHEFYNLNLEDFEASHWSAAGGRDKSRLLIGRANRDWRQRLKFYENIGQETHVKHV